MPFSAQRLFGVAILLSLCMGSAAQAQTAIPQQTLILNSRVAMNRSSGHATTTQNTVLIVPIVLDVPVQAVGRYSGRWGLSTRNSFDPALLSAPITIIVNTVNNTVNEASDDHPAEPKPQPCRGRCSGYLPLRLQSPSRL